MDLTPKRLDDDDRDFLFLRASTFTCGDTHLDGGMLTPWCFSYHLLKSLSLPATASDPQP